MNKKEGIIKRNLILISLFFLIFILSIILIIFLTTAVINTPPNNIWNVTIDGPQHSDDYGWGLAIDNNSNIYLVGFSSWTSSSSTDFYLGKFDSSGHNLWNATLNGPQNNIDEGYGIAIDNDSNIYITGDSYWSSVSTYDIYLGKFNSSGSNLWNFTLNGPQNKSDNGYAIAIDNNSNIYITGDSSWTSSLTTDLYLGKFNSSGSNLWNFTLNGPQNVYDYGNGIAIDNNSNIYVVGTSYWSSASTSDIYLGKFNSSGNNLWNATINGPQNNIDNGYAIAIDKDSNIYVTGESSWSSPSSTDIYLGKFNSSGSNLWNATINGPQNSTERGYGIATDSLGNIYITGLSYWSSALTPDIYLGKFNSSGSNLWNATLNGPKNNTDVGKGIAIDTNSNIYVAGYSRWSATGNSDIYLGKFLEDIIPPNIQITYPKNNFNFSFNNVNINYTVSDLRGVNSCWYSSDNSAVNTTLANCSNITAVNWGIGQHSVTIWANDSSGNENWSTVRFNVCLEAWSCSSWSECSIEGTQTRICTDANSCGTNETKPIEIQSCSSSRNFPYGAISTGIFTDLSPIKPAEVAINNVEIELTNIIINVNQKISSASLTITTLDISNPNLNTGLPAGNPYQTFEINITGMDNTAITNATIKFRVNSSWLKEKNGITSNINLYRKQTNETSWTILPTTLLGNDSQDYYFSSITPGFSTFSIFLGKYGCESGTKRCLNNESQICLGNSTWSVVDECKFGCDNGGCINKIAGINLQIIFYSVIVIVILSIIIVSYLLFRPKKKHKAQMR